MKLEHWYDLGYAVAYEPDTEVPGIILNFRLLSLCGDSAPPLYHNGYHPTESLAEAEAILLGRVKWDGCMDFSTECLHTCTAAGLRSFGEALNRVHALAGREIPEADQSAWEVEK